METSSQLVDAAAPTLPPANGHTKEVSPLSYSTRAAPQPPSATYATAGVDIDAGEEAVERIKPYVKKTFRPEVLSALGGFGGLFELDRSYVNPVLVSTMDGVGTKSVLARLTGRYDSIGLDLVAMLVDDLICQGAEPLFLLDYISIGRLDPEMVEQLVAGVAKGCELAGCSLIGGEMAEHPGVMPADDFDLSGAAVGVVEKAAVLDGSTISDGDVVIGMFSDGLRCNGYSLARHVLLDLAGKSLDEPAWAGSTHTLGEEMLRPSLIYSPGVLKAAEAARLHGVVHVTGGGIARNLERVLPGEVDVYIDRSTWSEPRIFDEIRCLGQVDEDEMELVFNLGVGMLIIVAPEDESVVTTALGAAGFASGSIGKVVAGTGSVHVGRPT